MTERFFCRCRLEDQLEVRRASASVAIALGHKRATTTARRGWLAPISSTGPTRSSPARRSGAAGSISAQTPADPAVDSEPAVLPAICLGAGSHQAVDRAELSATGALRRSHVLPLRYHLRLSASAIRAAAAISGRLGAASRGLPATLGEIPVDRPAKTAISPRVQRQKGGASRWSRLQGQLRAATAATAASGRAAGRDCAGISAANNIPRQEHALGAEAAADVPGADTVRRDGESHPVHAEGALHPEAVVRRRQGAVLLPQQGLLYGRRERRLGVSAGQAGRRETAALIDLRLCVTRFM